MSHMIKLLIIQQIEILISFYLFGECMNWDQLYYSFGFSSKPIIIGLILFFQFLFSPIEHVLNFIVNIISRKFEFQV